MEPAPFAVTVDAAALRDGRASAGIGRYVTGLLTALRGIEGLEVHRSVPGLRPHPDAWVIRYLNAQPALARARLHRGRQRDAVMHATSTDPSAVWPLRSQVVTVHDVEAWTSPSRPGPRHRGTAAYFGWQRRRFRRCGAIIAVSQASATEAIATLGLDPARMHVIGEGVAPVFRPAPREGPHDEALRAPAGLGAGRGAGGYVAWVGSLRTHEPRKAVDTLLRAASEMAPRPMLVLVGQGGEEADRVQRLANDLGVRTVCTGFVDDATLAAVYRGAGAVAIPSLQEGFGLPMLEAMACGVPVVASDTGNLAWLGRDGAAALVPPGDSHALAAALAGVLGDHGVAARLRAAGVRRAEEHTWHEAAVRTVEVYREVAAGCSR